MENSKICEYCNSPVIANADNYEIFENMHWLCFHLNFEHSGDRDESCDDPSCPWWHIEIYIEKLKSLGLDPQTVIEDAVKERWRNESHK